MLHGTVRVAALVLGLATVARSESAESPARFAVSVASIRPGVPFHVAAVLRIPGGAHVAWKNPGDYGMAPELAFDLPPGFEAGSVAWPVPRRFVHDGLAAFGFESNLTLVAEIRPGPGVPAGADASIRVRFQWMTCGEACVPGSAGATLTLPVRASEPEPSADAALFRSAAAERPETWPGGWTAAWRTLDRRCVLTLTSAAPGGWPEGRYEFFPERADLVDQAADPVVRRTGGTLEFDFERAVNGAVPDAVVRGVLVVRRADGTCLRAWELEARAADAPRSPERGEEK